MLLTEVKQVLGVQAYFGWVDAPVSRLEPHLAELMGISWRRRRRPMFAWLHGQAVDESPDRSLVGCVPAYGVAELDSGTTGLLNQFGRELGHLVRQGWLKLPELSRLLDHQADTLERRAIQLPTRQRQVLVKLLLGRHIKGIAHDLDLSVHTLRDHLARLYRYWGVSRRNKLMAMFMDQ